MERIPVGRSGDFSEGIGAYVEAGGHRLAVFRIEGELFAIGDRCSHAEASLSEGEIFDHGVECPRHGSEFDVRTGEPSSLPATRPVPTYRVEVEDDKVYVLVEPLSAEETG